MFRLNFFRFTVLVVLAVLSNLYLPSTSKRVKKGAAPLTGCNTKNTASLIFKGSPTPNTGNLLNWLSKQKVSGAFFIAVDNIINDNYIQTVKNIPGFNNTLGFYIADDSQFQNITTHVNVLQSIVGFIPQYIFFEDGCSEGNKGAAVDMGFTVISDGFDSKNNRPFAVTLADFSTFLSGPKDNLIILFNDNEYSQMNEGEYISVITNIRSNNINIVPLTICTNTNGKLSNLKNPNFKQSSGASYL